jgi:hypothetical protein
MEFPSELLNSIAIVLEVIVAAMTGLLVAFWIGLVIWTFRDIRSRTRDAVGAGLRPDRLAALPVAAAP